MDRRTSVRETFTPGQLEYTAVPFTVWNDLLDLGILDGSLSSGEKLVISEEVVVHGSILGGDGQTRTAEHPNEVRTRFYEDEVVF